MNGYQRIISAIEGRKPDWIPVMLHNFMMAAREYGVTMGEFRKSAKIIADCFIASIEKYQYDGIVVDIDTATLAGAVGVPVDFPEDEPARCIAGCMDDLKMVNDLEPVNIRDYSGVQVWLEAVSRLREYFGDEILIRGNCDQCPFSLASMMRTPALWMMDLIDESRRESVIKLLEYCTNVTKQFIRLMVKAGAHMTSNGDSPAGPDMISPEMYRAFAFPYEKKVASYSRELGVPYVLHICGKTTPILEDMVLAGADGLELDYKTDAVKAREVLNERAVFIGNIDPVGVLAYGTVKQVEEKTEELLGIFAGTSRFILNAGCALPPDTPEENIKAMIRVARGGI